MLFAAYTPYTPQSGYTPPRKSASPWVIVAGLCGGCVLLVMIGAFALTYIGFKKFGGFTLRTISSAQFFDHLKRHDYAKAETVLTPSAQAKFNADWLAKDEQSAEDRLGPLQQSVSAYQNQHIKSVDDFNKVVDIPFTLIYERGTRKVSLHFDSAGDNKIADIDWSAKGSGEGAATSGSDTDSKESSPKH